MSEINCTTPYGPNKTFICTDQEKGKLASKLYIDTFEKRDKIPKEQCPSPCSYITSRVMKTNERFQSYYKKKKAAKMEISTRENIKVTEAHWLYTGKVFIHKSRGEVSLLLRHNQIDTIK